MKIRTIVGLLVVLLSWAAVAKDKVVVVPLFGDEKTAEPVDCVWLLNDFQNITGTVLERIVFCPTGFRVMSGGVQSNLDGENGCTLASNHPVFRGPTFTEEGWLVKWSSTPANVCASFEYLSYALCCTDIR